ncbi:glycosyl transferase family 90 [Neorhizobium sp. DAR64872/K0K18]|uniref:glycosyl transferase family 90 n=1 Tax=Neorhizobium sp. DAR64872/K0K18 TaxID=3421958 RepID=UPI003D293DC8
MITYAEEVLTLLPLSRIPEKGLSFVFQGEDAPRDILSVSWQRKMTYQNVTLLPDFYYTEARGYEDVLREGVTSWADRKPVALWRGSTTGAVPAGGWLTQQNVHTLPRYRLCEIGSRNRPAMDFGFTNVVQAANLDEEQAIRGILVGKDLCRGWATPEDYMSHKFFVQIDGNGNSWELLKKLRLGCCMLLVDSDWQLWPNQFLQPWVHYVPVANDLSDIEQKVAWCVENDTKAKTIAKQGRNYATNLDYEDDIMASLSRISGNALFHL